MDYNIEAMRANNNTLYCFGMLTVRALLTLNKECRNQGKTPVTDACPASGILTEAYAVIRDTASDEDLHDTWFATLGTEATETAIPTLVHIVNDHEGYEDLMMAALSDPSLTAWIDQTSAAINETKAMSRRFFEQVQAIGVEIDPNRVDILVDRPELILNWETVPAYRRIEVELWDLNDKGFTMLPGAFPL